jgi:hypothetical protein
VEVRKGGGKAGLYGEEQELDAQCSVWGWPGVLGVR